MWSNGFFILYCSLVSLPLCTVEAWSGHVCTRSWVTYFTERYCARYDWWTAAYFCKNWKTRRSSKTSYIQHCCNGWKHKGNQICNIPTSFKTVPTNTSIIAASKYTENGDEFSTEISIVKRQVKSCGGYLTTQTGTTTLTSPNYPFQYENNLRCYWTIEAPVNYVIVIRITYLELEENAYCSFDYLSINLGINPSLETNRICTNKTKDLTFVTRSNQAIVSFVTDGSVAKTGFSIQYEGTNCGGRLQAGPISATLYSPYYPLQYDNNLYCHWTIESSTNYRIMIEIVFIDLEENSDCSYDYLQIYLGERNMFGTSRICRYKLKELNFITRSDKADIVFTTDGSIKKTGFVLNYKTVPHCGEYLTAETAKSSLISPQYPSEYENNLQCIWTMKGPIHYRIVLNITYIDIEKNGDDCPYDFLQIYLGTHYIMKTNRICGSDTKGLVFISGSNELDVIFVTDGSITKTGFSLQYHAAPCGGRLTAGTTADTLFSPNYPLPYDIYLRCHWTIEAPVNHRIVISITDIDVEENLDCSYDYIQIYLGNNYMLETNRICRINNVSLNSISMSDEVHIIFITDGSNAGRGFSLHYHAVINCGGNLTAQIAISKLTSPHYPFRYEKNLRCHWILEAPVSYRIFINITNVDLDENGNCSSGYLQLYLGTNYTFPTDRICMNNIQDLNFITMSNKADVIFVTYGTMTKTEFSLRYHAAPYYERHLTAQTVTSSLSSPNYPFHSENNQYCHWTIEASINYRIVINITNIESDENNDCSSNYLEIFLGTNDTTKMHRICNNNTDDLAFITTSNQADINYVTNGKLGFLLQYKAVYICGGHLIAQTTEKKLSSPNYPYKYENNLRCHWTIEAPLNLKIAIHITNIDIEDDGGCYHDYLQFDLGSNLTSTTDRICRNNTENLNFVTTSNRADAIFVTDAAITNTGFSLQYQAVASCGGHLTAQTTIATLTSPHYPSLYENNLYCQWTIEAPINYSIAIQITNVDLEENNICSHDYLQIHLGINSTDRICMNNTKDLKFVTVSNQAEVIFVTDANRAKKGFSLQYQAGTCYCEGETDHVDCFTDLNQLHQDIYANGNVNCMKRLDDIPKSKEAGSARVEVKILIPSVAGLVVAIVVTLGLCFYCRRRRRAVRAQKRKEERPYTELQSMKTFQHYETREANYYENVNMPDNSGQIQVSTIYENLRITG